MFDYQRSVARRAQVMIDAVVPVGVVGLSGGTRRSLPHAAGAVAIDARLLFLLSPNEVYFGAAAGPVFTFGNRDHHFSLGALGGGAFALPIQGGIEKRAAFVLPFVGLSVRAAPKVRLVAELVIPPIFSEGEDPFRAIFLAYGGRFGADFFGEVGFARVFCQECTNYFEYIPMGMPYFSLGQRF